MKNMLSAYDVGKVEVRASLITEDNFYHDSAYIKKLKAMAKKRPENLLLAGHEIDIITGERVD